jgi:ABC-2 type transport system permease protein
MTFATIMPTVFLSGFFFPLEAMPWVLQLISFIIPAKYGLIIVRSILLKGVGLEILREQVVAILIFAAVIVTLASTRFKKKLG